MAFYDFLLYGIQSNGGNKWQRKSKIGAISGIQFGLHAQNSLTLLALKVASIMLRLNNVITRKNIGVAAKNHNKSAQLSRTL